MVLTTQQYYVMQQNGFFKGLRISPKADSEGSYTVRLSGSEWKVFQTNMGSSGEVTEVSGGPGAAGAIKISVTMDSSTEGLYSTVPCP